MKMDRSRHAGINGELHGDNTLDEEPHPPSPFIYEKPTQYHTLDPEGHSVSGQVRAQRSRALKAWVKIADVPSGSIQTRHQDPEGLSGNGTRGTKNAKGCGQGAVHYQDPFRHGIRSPDGYYER
ncbi:hypothetical protein ACLOJK_024338, partial [Asimina triloba]